MSIYTDEEREIFAGIKLHILSPTITFSRKVELPSSLRTCALIFRYIIQHFFLSFFFFKCLSGCYYRYLRNSNFSLHAQTTTIITMVIRRAATENLVSRKMGGGNSRVGFGIFENTMNIKYSYINEIWFLLWGF